MGTFSNYNFMLHNFIFITLEYRLYNSQIGIIFVFLRGDKIISLESIVERRGQNVLELQVSIISMYSRQLSVYTLVTLGNCLYVL